MFPSYSSSIPQNPSLSQGKPRPEVGPRSKRHSKSYFPKVESEESCNYNQFFRLTSSQQGYMQKKPRVGEAPAKYLDLLGIIGLCTGMLKYC